MTDSCKLCGARRDRIRTRTGSFMPVQIDEHKQATEINAMIEEEKIAKLQEREHTVEAVVPRKRRRKTTE